MFKRFIKNKKNKKPFIIESALGQPHKICTQCNRTYGLCEYPKCEKIVLGDIVRFKHDEESGSLDGLYYTVPSRFTSEIQPVNRFNLVSINTWEEITPSASVDNLRKVDGPELVSIIADLRKLENKKNYFKK